MGVLIGSVILGACGGVDDPAPFVPVGESAPVPTAQPNALEQALQEATGVPWAVDVDEATGLALFAKPLKPVTVGMSGAESLAFVGKYPQVFGVKPGELVVTRDEQDAAGSKLVSMLQRIADTEVQGSSLAVHLGPSGSVTFIEGHGYRAAGATTPAHTEAEARTAAATAAGQPAPTTPAQLVFLPHPARAAKDARLVFRVSVGSGVSAKTYFVDAATLEVLRVEASLAAVDGSGTGASGHEHSFAVTQKGSTYELQSTDGTYPSKLRTLDLSGGKLDTAPVVSSTSPSEWLSTAAPERKGQAVDAYGYAIAAMKYWSTRFQQRSYDDAGGAFDVIVHGPGAEYNALGGYLGDGRAIMLFTDGVPAKSYKTLATAPDVVGHEFAHLIQMGVLGKKPQTDAESKAIEEGLADVFGSLFEAANGGGDPSTIGEAALTGGVRNLKDPTLCDKAFNGPCPTDVDDAAAKSADPHIPGAIVGHAFYLYSYGGEHASPKVAITDPISTKQSEDLYFATVKKCYRAGVTFKSLAQCQIEEAKALKIPFQPVACAWTAVKVMSLEDAKKRYDVSCDGAISCEGKTDGFYCAPDTTNRKATSYQCAGGKIRSQDTCSVCVEHHEDRGKAHCDE